MTRLFNYFALVVMGALICGCAEEVDDAQPSVGGTVTMKTTVSLSENASTRALTEAGVKTFAAGDQIAVVYEQASGTAKALSVALTDDDITNSGKDAAFTVTLSSPKANGKVRYIYPASRAATYIASDVAPDNAATINYAALATQDGTFPSLASNLDLSTFDGEMTAQGNLPKTASLVNPLTIGKFTIKNSAGTSDLTSSITGLSINDGSNTYVVTRTADAGPIYVAMKPITSSQTVVVNATDNTYYYTKSVSGQTLAANNIYDIKVKTIRGVDLSALTTDYIAQNGDVLMGTLDATHYPVKISIAAGATVTLNGVNIIGIHEDDDAHKHAGITCLGNATIILADGTTNIVKGFHENYSGIQPAHNTSGDEYTLTIQGSGSLNASTNGDSAGSGAGIGSGNSDRCGNITISGGNVTATGGHSSAGIGCGKFGKCGTITISGGTVTATGGPNAAGIGSGTEGTFTSINITDAILSVIAARGDANATAPIGRGYNDTTSGAVTIDGTTTWTAGTNTTHLKFMESGNTWTLSYNVYSAASAVTGDLGKVIGADGNIYANATQASALGTTAVAMIAYVGSQTGSTTYNHGLAIALTDATISYCKWSDNKSISISASASYTMTDHKGFLNGIDATDAFTSTTPPLGADYTAAKKAKNYGVTAPTGTSGWFLPSSGQWLKFFEAAGVDVVNWTSWGLAPAPSGGTQADNWTKINALLSAVGGAVKQDYYWSSSEYYDFFGAVGVFFSSSSGVTLHYYTKDGDYCYVRSFLAF